MERLKLDYVSPWTETIELLDPFSILANSDDEEVGVLPGDGVMGKENDSFFEEFFGADVDSYDLWGDDVVSP